MACKKVECSTILNTVDLRLHLLQNGWLNTLSRKLATPFWKIKVIGYSTMVH